MLDVDVVWHKSTNRLLWLTLSFWLNKLTPYTILHENEVTLNRTRTHIKNGMAGEVDVVKDRGVKSMLYLIKSHSIAAFISVTYCVSKGWLVASTAVIVMLSMSSSVSSRSIVSICSSLQAAWSKPWKAHKDMSVWVRRIAYPKVFWQVFYIIGNSFTLMGHRLRLWRGMPSCRHENAWCYVLTSVIAVAKN